jgi:hypothetical protein
MTAEQHDSTGAAEKFAHPAPCGRLVAPADGNRFEASPLLRERGGFSALLRKMVQGLVLPISQTGRDRIFTISSAILLFSRDYSIGLEV